MKNNDGGPAFPSKELLDRPVSWLRIPALARNALVWSGIRTIRELVRLMPCDLLSKRRFGELSLRHVERGLSDNNLYLGMDLEPVTENIVVTGITKLDYFAAEAMKGMMDARNLIMLKKDVSQVVTTAFFVAEAMLAESERRNDGKA